MSQIIIYEKQKIKTYDIESLVVLSGGAASGLRGARFPLWGTGGGFGRAVLEYTELLAGKRADNVYQASFSRSECVVQKREMSRGTGGD